MARVAFAKVDKFYGAVQALHDVSLDIEDGEFVVFVGPSGCGKSTLLRAIAGLESISAGVISIGDKDVTAVAPSDRGVAMVFQSYALYPHMSVRANMEFGMKVNGVPVAERGERVAEAARILQLEDLMERKPGQLSGGQRQRVAIGRAIVKEPQVFLFDEPLSNLDAKLRVQMRVELEALHEQLGATMIYVTHDQVEAMTMADKIVVLNGGRVEQVGPPLELYHRPATEFVAGFIGAPSMNFLDVQLRAAQGGTEAVYGTAAIPLGMTLGQDGAGRLGIRPEHLRLTEAGTGAVDIEVQVAEALGGETYLYGRTALGDRLVVKVDGDSTVHAGLSLGLHFDAERLHLFAADGRSLRA
ncbi:sn-glycerol-3-phosphate ABC transporter ATP-binding protein UgpC [Pelagibius litoralis]|uniref:Sn-glycerol-3-phosphate ABC transporter ATP-binding protein UgpC n=1 Tax=Pelagibius litoralis TaxID=374515 RepID=A0A967KGA3_9PROT|nr:sn-glycerol-3-phosphate ABC transporter ATP-binding protein UgpC [Pelagibius litoralis]NIA70186.1 sn-glycerol-3-phosphate ABC transporter ATP-binding protein UgpC [Pelagibius litoralis]